MYNTSEFAHINFRQGGWSVPQSPGGWTGMLVTVKAHHGGPLRARAGFRGGLSLDDWG